MSKDSILLIYTGGTIGMIEDAGSRSLRPFDFDQIDKQVPELKKLNLLIDTYSFSNPIDSSNMNPHYWKELVGVIKKNYLKYDGFVILHGSDTMAYTASALSFMLENLSKPVILTGSQLPIGTLRTDGKENLITAIEIAGAKNEKGHPIVPEVGIYFEFQLYRGNRTTKVSTEVFEAFQSYNYRDLAQVGVHIKYNKEYIRSLSIDNSDLNVFDELDNNVAILKIFPGISEKVVTSIFEVEGIKGVIIETYGSGNATNEDWFLNLLKEAIQKGIIIFNVTQCPSGGVIQGMYEASEKLDEMGVISGKDITLEAAITKMMYLFGKYSDTEKIKMLLPTSVSGEITDNF